MADRQEVGRRLNNREIQLSRIDDESAPCSGFEA